MKKRMIKLFALSASLIITMLPMQRASADTSTAAIRINEVNSSPDDWVELINVGTEAVDLSDYEIRDNSDDHRWKFASGVVVQPGGVLVVDASTIGLVYDDETDSYSAGNFESAIGIGSGDSIRVYNEDGDIIDECSWTEHASYKGDPALASIGRYPDGTGPFMIMKETKGLANELHKSQVVINEVQSNDPNGGQDWIELANPTNTDIDVSNIVVKDNDDSHIYTMPSGTVISANGFLVIHEDELGFGLGKNDSVRLYENGVLIGSTTWSEHTNPTWGLYPDVNGTEYRSTLEETKGAANKFAKEVESIEWPGQATVEIFDKEARFLEDSSGLDFFNGQLYAVDNGTGKFWIMNVALDGKISFENGFENGKRVRFKKDAGNSAAAGPDAEGITVDGKGMVYIASERDNSAKGVNYDTILMVDPSEMGDDLIAKREWDLTDSLPAVSANMGIEAVEWVSSVNVAGKIIDQNTNSAFDISNYPNAIADGVFFVALEDNGHAYCYVLNDDETCVQIADIDSKLGGAMALDYDTYENVLWVVADNGYNNKAAKIKFNGTDKVDITHVNPPAGLDITANFEGFAIAEYTYTRSGQRPVYRFLDGVKTGALSVGGMSCNYVAPVTPTDKESNDTEGNKVSNEKKNEATTSAVKSPVTGDVSSLHFLITMGAGILFIKASTRKRLSK